MTAPAPEGLATAGPDLLAPWTVVEAAAHHGIYIEDCAGRTVCDLYALDDRREPRSFPMAAEVAPLIASAPEMLAALQEIRRILDDEDRRMFTALGDIRDEVDAALRASGRGDGGGRES